MKLQNIGVIRQFELPSGFVRGEQLRGAIGNSWRLSFHPENNDAVEIIAFQRGLPLCAEDSTAFRQLLRRGGGQIIGPDLAVADEPVALLHQLGQTLGNAANNQLVNQAEGLRGPAFQLAALEAREIGERTVLVLTGRFHRTGAKLEAIADLDDERARKADGSVYYQGLFMDGSSWHRPCQVEELLLQADTYKLFAQYQPLFAEAVGTMLWQEK